jgi:Domain of unknown function (DUF4190)
MNLASPGSCPPPGHGQMSASGARSPGPAPVSRLAIISLAVALVPVSASALWIITASRYTYPAAVVAVAFVIAVFTGAICAIIIGHWARARIRRTGERGRGLAAAGLVVGYLLLIIWTLEFLILLGMNVTGPGI